ncbi:NAD-dependent epimerase/dehydratase family protein [Macrococcus lamae]|uniref:NAD-dependent epimerase/dehydratase family protein n=1 Tax=Macrococcus lamae TaxID=198484 RepID=A0A4R6BV98_9STAP|nr:NAD-dependent epimerase/dehydratase family protein [Macrococcus lamae]TDM12268.1 NAD-dependent epimerase/dehydratase family protein [Macrococcus lamae]
MRSRVLLTGTSGYIGSYLYEALKEDVDVVAMSKYPEALKKALSWIQGDIFNLEDVKRAMEGIDFAVYYLDPTKRSSKTTEANFNDLNALAADNYARAAEHNNIKEIIYIGGATEDAETLKILRHYKTPVRVTGSKIRRKGIMAQDQSSRKDDVRVLVRYKLPKSWSLEKFITHYFNYYNDIVPKVSNVEYKNNSYYLQARTIDLVILKQISDSSNNDRQQFEISGGTLVQKSRDNKGRLEFRRLIDSNEVIVGIHDYVPAMPKWFYQFCQSPFHHVTMRVLDVEMRIQMFNDENSQGMTRTYTKD